MKIALLILSFLFIGAAVSQVTREECLQTGIMDGDLPATVPVENTGYCHINYNIILTAHTL